MYPCYTLPIIECARITLTVRELLRCTIDLVIREKAATARTAIAIPAGPNNVVTCTTANMIGSGPPKGYHLHSPL